MRQRLDDLTKGVIARLRGKERLLLNYQGESSDFVRIGNSRIRQAGHVDQHYLDLELVDGRRHLSIRLPLTGEPGTDLENASRGLMRLREQLPHVPEDPYLNLPSSVTETSRETASLLPDSGDALDQLISVADGLDLVGHWASGSMDYGFADSQGTRHWHSGNSFNLDWSCYLQGDLAVKNAYAGAVQITAK